MTDRNLETSNLAQLAAQALSEEPPALEARFDDRTGQIGAIAQALRVRGRHRWIVRHAIAATLFAAPAAAALVLWVSASSYTRPSLPPAAATGPPTSSVRAPMLASLEGVQGAIELAGVERDLVPGDEIAAGTGVSVSETGRAVLRLSTGTRITLSDGGSARVSELGALTRFDLSHGRFDAEVVKLVPGQRFLVVTPDVEVEVKGTRFEVAVASTASSCGVSTRTSVAVRSGVVAVRFASHELHLAAGEHWPDCRPVEDEPPRAPAASEKRGTHRRAAHARRTEAASVPSLPPPSSADVASAPPLPRPSSTLSQQNDLLAAALAAERRGDLDEAERWLDQLMGRYPSGQLADSARAARRRLEAVRASKASDR
jgi:hypothetical protein